MAEKKYLWHKLAANRDEIIFSSNNIADLEVAGKSLSIVLYDNQLFCCTQKCPHAGGRLSNGYIDTAGNIVCPLHRYKFNLANGRNISGEGYFLKTFPIEIREEGIYVGFEETSLFNWGSR